MMYHFCLDRVRQINDILLCEEKPRAKLSRIKKIWDARPLIINRRFELLDSLVGQICAALKQQITFEEQQRDMIELERDELNRRQYEADMLHVCNSVLDNCLSTLKHETMYYPSRIRQLVEATPFDQEALEEVVSYYKSLYSILSRQALRQTDKPMRIDDAVWAWMFDVLKVHNKGAVNFIVSPRDQHYLNVAVSMSGYPLTAEECRLLFTPSTKDVWFLVCRQILRELGENSHARACGIEAHPAKQGIVINMVVPAGTRFFTQYVTVTYGEGDLLNENQ